MTAVSALWLPILLAAVIVFVVSSIIHMTPLWHRNDFPKAAREDEILDALRPLAIPPGEYMLPRAGSMKEMGAPEFVAKLNRGPVLMLRVLPNGPSGIGRSLVLWFIYSLVVGYFSAYVAGHGLAPGADYLRVFQLIGATAFVGYALALVQLSIWYRRPWGPTVKALFDGLIYAALTAGTFGWLWPHAA
jgi:hypothetical protein